MLRPTAFFKCAPTASTFGPVFLSCTGSGAKPRARRRTISRPRTTRTIESSIGRTIGRLWTRKKSAMPSSRVIASFSSMQIGSSLRLPLVATTGKPKSRINR
jgi:hypothetical protein